MKKYLAFLLVLVMILSVSLVACKKNAEEPSDDDDDGWGNGGGTTTESIAGDDNNDDNKGENNTPVTLTWNDIEDITAYVAYPVVLRSSASDSAKTGITLNFGDSVLVTQKSSDGRWYMVSYGEGTYYLYAYVTVTNLAEVTFEDITPELTTVIADKQTNLRNFPCYGGDNYDAELQELGIIAVSGVNTQASVDGKLTVTGINQTKTWIRVQYTTKVDGVDVTNTYYCRPAYLAKYQSTNTNPGTNVNPA